MSSTNAQQSAASSGSPDRSTAGSAAPADGSTAPAVPPPPPPERRARDPWFDNAKMILVTLVVVGHSWTLLPLFASDPPGSPTARAVDNALYDALYLWHIPAFVIVTGYLSKSFEYTLPRLRQLVTTVVVPYIVFEGLLVGFRAYFLDIEFKNVWLSPHWPMWYLSALFVWRLLTPVLKRMPAKVVVAVVVSLLAGLFATDYLDNARILGLLPFFALGLKMHEGHWALLRARRARVWGTVVLTLLVLLAPVIDNLVATEWLYYRSRYSAIDPSLTSDGRAFAIRATMLILGLVGAFAFFAVVPRGRTFFTSMGGATLVVYLYHGFFVLSAEALDYKYWAASAWPLSWVVTTAAAVGVALLLAWDPVARRLNVLIDPVGSISRRRRRRREPDPTSA